MTRSRKESISPWHGLVQPVESSEIQNENKTIEIAIRFKTYSGCLPDNAG